MKLISYALFSAVLVGTIFSGAANAATYSAVNDFSLTGNPNGPWGYLYGSNNLLQTTVVGSGTQTGLDYWWDSMPVPNSTIIGRNVTSSPITFLTIVDPVNYLLMDPETKSNVDLRFTAPSAGNYSITGAFLGIDIDENAHPIEITDNGAVIFSGTIASYGQSDPFNLTETLNAGDVLDFEVLTGSTYTYLSTGLAATITPATSAMPEPATFLGVSLALFGLIVARSIKTRVGESRMDR